MIGTLAAADHTKRPGKEGAGVEVEGEITKGVGLGIGVGGIKVKILDDVLSIFRRVA